MERLLEAYLEHLRIQGYSSSSASHARAVLPRLFDHLRREGVRDVRAAREADLVSFLAWTKECRTRSGELVTPWTVVGYLTCVRAFFAFLDFSMPDCIFAFRFFSCKSRSHFKHTDNAHASRPSPPSR